ncbi:MAG: head-tail joining protein [Serratia proteamaculans]
MDGFDNLFDEALFDVDNRIIEVMGREMAVFINDASTPIRAVFDDPESIDYASGGNVRIEGTSPRLFVKSAAVAQLQRLDVVRIGADRYWVDRIAPDDTGSRYIYLGVGDPPANTRRR